MNQRAIKFRAWDILQKKMLPNSITLFANPLSQWDDKEVVLMQFTGLKDKNGKEIYEGDIVSPLHWKPHIYQVGFDRGSFCFFKGDDPIATDAKYFEDCEVIGNIYENPELVK
jgi:uncharacterized phage protein (TIGR01671 family)